jgi:UDP-2,3-diacylglucosamine pyrophosphatase LpxH
MTKSKNLYSKTVHGAVTTIRIGEIKAGWEQWFLLMSDNHHDSIYCNRELEVQHLEKAKKRNARIMIFGDFFDAMQGRFDPRRNMDELRPEYRREDYYDIVVKDTANFFKPYAQLIDLISDGNHELAVLKNANTNLADRLVFSLNGQGANVIHGGYGGWIRFLLETGSRTSINMKYFHGAGGEAPVTKGVIQTNRQAVFLPDADVVVNGHNHNSYWLPISRERISNQGALYMDIQHHIRIPGYEQSYGDGSKGWDVTRGGVPKPIGAIWMRMWFDPADGHKRNHNGRVKLEFTADVQGAEPVSATDDLFSGKVYDDDQEGV